MINKLLLLGTAGIFYILLIVYVASELYYNHTYWRLVLRKKRRHRWEFMLWLERTLLIIIGVIVILIAMVKI
ncbi:MAG: hypothetical protein COS94_07020 [Candidatus Hydrogenedentes bacterium CG07_land_8_20_14_0_80_42_17]|nr:MAG: hypothetical protein AUJ18_02280 [Candidatus Hydrogenedentes bacterium CG1_02_42_14]PIU47515.1 MAG: hypothetical protein COS94_07020 [Candidatus Hydrogenedentes bacterium CG07_land_8_20_14_0_80_42_17]